MGLLFSRLFFSSALLGTVLLGGCAGGPHPISALDTASGHVALVDLPNDGGYAIVSGDRQTLPLPGLTRASLVGYWALRSQPILVLEGSSKDCATLYDLIEIHPGHAAEHRLPTCGGHFGFTVRDDSLIATELDVARPRLWAFRNGDLTGPVQRAGRRVSRPVHQTASSVARANEAPDGQTQYLDEMLRPPVVQSEIGNEVIPASVGEGKAADRPTIVQLR